MQIKQNWKLNKNSILWFYEYFVNFKFMFEKVNMYFDEIKTLSWEHASFAKGDDLSSRHFGLLAIMMLGVCFPNHC